MEAQAHAAFDEPAAEVPELPRTVTGLRVLYTLVCIGALQIVAAILALLVLFELVFALVTRKKPHRRVQTFGDDLARYTRHVMRYVTYNDDQPPFPFADLPNRTDP